ncbi:MULTISPECIES: aminotransferase class I/II-fold pyridoxal phosphate-dependent enzyme [unclassified Neisseria]|uniref:aminotransferase class I/II-fold pyridoxal phosphate-dependent enzyme n=1 Tax=unclassified Neisseria TaxID=2623750 RepID=UPI002666C420|nr:MULTISPECIES: aminotransferase class I/II-fold pyridoxal phosphate-dependent enzyme [unclassified Neisseria]MDO1510544.1 aminotransferase class I/II-fold pyridoxal phosphate-dependent enzyme [Neisseria sp. MVDL19-042950]MDO1516337.1 aminotransferase class I/II-fold pyridoxal phosphate-dependent enzyme [Neisseria sp. MVDL18-041461]MDO1564117.1 aminotransferase class I/II-fold pyridoxal phosphate-dependent enzyme [Neisseria sp. MVDL20-010259]
MSELKPKGNTAVNIARSIEQLIRNESWPAGYRLPTVRTLAEDLHVNANTVSAAYKQLRDAGIIETDGRRGSFVPPKTEILHTETAVPPNLVDLASGNIDHRLLPELNPDILESYRLSTDVGCHGDSPELMAFIQNWLDRNTGIHTETMLLSSSLEIIERALTQRCMPGAKVLIESPCWLPLPALLSHLRLEAVAAEMDEEGALIPSDLSPDDVSAVILTARAHSPTGICYSKNRWQQWQQWLSRHNPLLIIDDHWAALSRKPFHGMEGFTNEWIYSTSTSKFLGTDARIAIAASNGPTLRAMKKRFSLGPRWISKLLQHITLYLWQQLDSDGLPNIAESYQSRRDSLITHLKQHGIYVPGSTGEGQHIWLPVPNESQIIQFLAAKGWAVQSGASFNFGKKPAVRITIGNLTLADCKTLADDIAETLAVNGKAIY